MRAPVTLQMLWLGSHFVKEAGVDVIRRSADPVDTLLALLMVGLVRATRRAAARAPLSRLVSSL